MALQRRAHDLDLDTGSTISDAVPGKETQVQRIAAQGVSGAGGALPFADTIADSFGPAHAGTVHAIQAHTGGTATAASRDIGAEAYATGNAVAFAGTPSLHTAAHEAAHVVQQRQGVHLKGGVGEAGDPYERHADAVADRVVAGLSAASLLGDAGAASVAPAVQRKAAPKKPSPADEEKKAHDQFEADGPRVVYALAGLFRDSKYMMDSMPSKYVDALTKLRRIVRGDGPSGRQRMLDGREQRALLDEAYPILEPFARANAHFGGDDDNLPTEMTNLRSRVIAAEASDRVDNAVVVGEGKDKKAMEMPDDGHPREQAAVLKVTLPKLVGTMKKTVERAAKLGKAANIDKEMLERLEVAENILTIGESYLELSDQEFQNRFKEISGVMNGVATYSDLVKHILEIGKSSISLTCKASALLMKAVGDHAMAEACELTGEAVSTALSSVVAAVEIVHGVSVFFDSKATTDDRIGAGVEIATGVATLAGGPIAGMPIMGPYALIKGAQYLLSEAIIGWDTDLVRGAFQKMQAEAILIGQSMESLAAAQLLQQQEQDPERRAALAAEEKIRVDGLGGMLRSFLRETEHRDHGAGEIYAPGNIQIIADAFAVQRGHGAAAHTQAQIVELAHDVSQKIVWCFKHGPAIIKATATHRDITEVNGIEEKLEKDAKKDE